MGKFEKISSYVAPLISVLLGYQFYDTISEHLFLRCWFYATIIIIACMVVTDIISMNNEAQGLKSFLRGIRYVCLFALAGCLFAGIYYRIEDNKVVITGEVTTDSVSKNEEPAITISESEITGQDSFTDTSSFFEDDSTFNMLAEDTTSSIPGIVDDDSLLEVSGDLGGSDGFLIANEGGWYYRVSSAYTYMATISNYSQRSIEIKVKDAITLELLDFIPYDQLDLTEYPMGGEGGSYPLVFHFDMDTNKDIQRVSRVTENDADVDKDVYYTVEPNEIRELSMSVCFQEEGLYRFKFSINYYKKGVKYTQPFPGCVCVFKKFS